MRLKLIMLLFIALLIPANLAVGQAGWSIETGRCHFENRSDERNVLKIPFATEVSLQNRRQVLIDTITIICRLRTTDTFWRAKYCLQRYNPERRRWARIKCDTVVESRMPLESMTLTYGCNTNASRSYRFRETLTLSIVRVNAIPERFVSKSYSGSFGIFRCY